MRLLILHPQVATRSCEDCQQHVYDEKTGRRQEHRGEPVKRPKGTFPPCGYGPDKCPKGNPKAGRELTLKNWLAWEHFQECNATGQFPDDEIARTNARLIRGVLDEIERNEQQLMRMMLEASLGIKRATGGR